MINEHDESDHDLRELPKWAPPDRSGDQGLTCPFMLNDGTVCGEDMAYAHDVREYHGVRSWTTAGIVIGEANEIDALEDEDAHLWCGAGHEWVVPPKVQFE